MNLGTILTETAARDPGHAAVSVERLGREISPSGYPVGDTFTVADLTVAALRYPVAREFPYPMIADGDLPDS